MSEGRRQEQPVVAPGKSSYTMHLIQYLRPASIVDALEWFSSKRRAVMEGGGGGVVGAQLAAESVAVRFVEKMCWLAQRYIPSNSR
jgi:hypothetical protein